jgi:ribosomal protein S18 acetylase RimI-like enzyme
MIRSMKTHIRPDGRHFVWDPDAGSVAEAKADLYCTVESTEVDPYLALGFEVNRREGMYLLPIRAVRIDPLQGVVFAQADEVDETTLRLLDDELRQDVPGTNGWQWPEAGFREETYEAAEFDPTTYLVAVDSAMREYIGIVRVWMKEPTPRLGFIGVHRRYRRRGIARALLAEVFSRLVERGVSEVSTEIDETNTASRALFEGLGARRTGHLGRAGQTLRPNELARQATFPHARTAENFRSVVGSGVFSIIPTRADRGGAQGAGEPSSEQARD